MLLILFHSALMCVQALYPSVSAVSQSPCIVLSLERPKGGEPPGEEGERVDFGREGLFHGSRSWLGPEWTRRAALTNMAEDSG